MSRQICHDFARGHCSRNRCRFEHATREHRELQQRQQWEREAKAQRDARGEAFSAGRTHSMSPATPRKAQWPRAPVNLARLVCAWTAREELAREDEARRSKRKREEQEEEKRKREEQEEEERKREEEAAAAAAVSKRDDLENALRLQLECPVCMTMALRPIQQCPNGHTLCTECSKQCPACPICRASPTTIRNLSLEQLAADIKIECRHAGCDAALTHGSMTDHAAQCAHRPMQCPWPGCTAMIPAPSPVAVVEHLKTSHEAIIDGPLMRGEVRSTPLVVNWSFSEYPYSFPPIVLPSTSNCFYLLTACKVQPGPGSDRGDEVRIRAYALAPPTQMQGSQLSFAVCSKGRTLSLSCPTFNLLHDRRKVSVLKDADTLCLDRFLFYLDSASVEGLMLELKLS